MNERTINWDDLRSFLTVARSGRLTTASKHLGVDHSTLSRRILALEEGLQVRLFERSPAGYSITSEGQFLSEIAEHIENLAIQAQSALSTEADDPSGPIRLSLPEGFSTSFLIPCLDKLRTDNPNLQIELIADPTIASLAKREADIAVMMHRPEKGPLIAKKLCDFEYGLYGSEDFLKMFADIACFEDLSSAPLIGYIPSLIPTPSHNYLIDEVTERIPEVQISNILTQVEATVEGLGICLLPCFMASRRTELKRILTDEICFYKSYWLVTHKDPRFLKRNKLVKDFLYGEVRSSRSLLSPSRSR